MKNRRVSLADHSQGPVIDLDLVSGWNESYNFDELYRWDDLNLISSIDGHYIQDQYSPDKNTNAGLLDHYEKFRIEIVAETLCVF